MCRHARHADSSVEMKGRHAEWTPTKDYALLGHTVIIVHEEVSGR